MAVSAFVAAWVAGGLIYVAALMLTCSNRDTEEMRAGLLRYNLAAMTALLLFLCVWPVVFIGTMIGPPRR